MIRVNCHMSKPTHIAEHEKALSAYLNDMLFDEPTDPQLTKDTVLSQHIIEQTLSDSDKVDENWRDSPFQTLLFEIQGLKLAIPLHELNGILTWPEKPPPKIAGKPDWYLGLYSQDHKHTQIVDTAHIILPNTLKKNEDKPNFIILIADGKWGLACNKVNQVVTLSSEEIRWRKEAGKRPWLAGTVLDKMCSILNIEALIKQLEA